MALSSKLFCAIFAVSTFAVFGISELDDSTGFFQRRQLEYVTADAVEPATDVPVGEAHPQKAGADFFKNVVSRINVAIDKVRNDLETKARTVIIRAKEEMKTAGEQMNDELKETVRAAVRQRSLAFACCSMLYRCVATNRCCPKLHEDEQLGDPSAHAAHLYSNPYMLEELTHPSALRLSMQEDGIDFPPSALTLMYDPPVDDTDDISDGNHSDGYVQDVDDLMNVPKLICSSAQTKIPTNLGPAARQESGVGSAAASRLRGWNGLKQSEVGDEGAVSHTRSSSAPRSAAPSRPKLVGRLPHRAQSSRAAARVPEATSVLANDDTCEVGSADGSALRPSRTSRPRVGVSPGRTGPSPGRTVTSEPALQPAPPRPMGCLGPGAAGMSEATGISQDSSSSAGSRVEPRTLSRSLRDARACKSEAGAASIAAIMECVAMAQEVPQQQRPNSAKWATRLAAYEVGTN